MDRMNTGTNISITTMTVIGMTITMAATGTVATTIRTENRRC